MNTEYVETLIESILEYDEQHHPPFFILFYIPSNDEFGIYYNLYLTILAAQKKPQSHEMDAILIEISRHFGNVIYAADYKVMTPTEIITHLQNVCE
jgi:hypothetical protein